MILVISQGASQQNLLICSINRSTLLHKAQTWNWSIGWAGHGGNGSSGAVADGVWPSCAGEIHLSTTRLRLSQQCEL